MHKRILSQARVLRQAHTFRGIKLGYPLASVKRTLFSTPVSNLKVESTKASKKILKPEVCSGCGSKFQKDSPKLPGYLPEEAAAPPETKKSKLPSNYLSNLDVMKLLSGIDIDVQRRMFKENSKSLTDADHLPDLFNSSPIDKGKTSVLVCQRCYNLQHHEKMSTDWKENSKIDISFLRFLQEQPRSVIIYVVDAFDLSGSLIKGIQENLIGTNKNRRMVLVLNKKDLLPKGITPSFLNRYIREKLYEVGLLDSVLKHFLVSAKTREGLSQLVEFLQELGQGESDFYFVGCTNVGKSELINTLVNMATERGHHDRAKLKITTSVVPGTTMDLVKIPLQKLSKLFQQNTNIFEQPNFSVFDTPGIFNPLQLTHHLTHEELKMALPSKPFKPKTYRWEPGITPLFSKLMFLRALSFPWWTCTFRLSQRDKKNIRYHLQQPTCPYDKLDQG
ncbi:hypothetical protein DSO57_1026972 [Entomophthora muscae]|uniref:Uncharacterized protein n=1 Tax=Entomophthora muscae TaxID=34485 RepID=A0ACC2UNH7_9FUNG|nr:hypothetical protein DSO57_1026972 [Entomophthora muscae]